MKIPEEYVTSGKITREVRQWAKKNVSPGKTFLEVCEAVEREIVSRGGQPAFPCGIGVNEVTAHYAPQAGDGNKIEEKDVVKVDFGVQIDGYVTDTAITVTNDPEQSPLLEAAGSALNASIEVARRDQRIGEIGKAIQTEARRHGFRTISNLSGHTLERYTVHAGKSIPNVYVQNLPMLKKNEVFAIEPFLTAGDAAGYVVDSPQETIFSLVGRRRLARTELDQFVEFLWKERRTLPFTPRWFLESYKESKLISMLHELVRAKVVRSYPTLVEASGRPVAQFEHTMALDGADLVVLT